MDLEAAVSEYDANPSKQDLENPFIACLKDIDVLINAVGPSKMRNEEHTRIIDYETNRLLTDAAKQVGIKKFILVTSCGVTRPESGVAFMLNTMMGNVLG